MSYTTDELKKLPLCMNSDFQAIVQNIAHELNRKTFTAAITIARDGSKELTKDKPDDRDYCFRKLMEYASVKALYAPK